MFKYFLNRLSYVRSLISVLNELRDENEVTRCRFDVPDELFDEFQRYRKTPAYQSVYDKPNPLVSVCISTYNRAKLLTERSLCSVLSQDYTNLEIIIVGDGCTDETEKLVTRIDDRRIRFVNLLQRGSYPESPLLRWMVAGTFAVNHALELAHGDFITHLDDDDEHSSDRTTKLVKFIQETHADIVWHPFWTENSDQRWRLVDDPQFRRNNVTTSAVLYHNWFKRIPWDINAYKFREPGDWNRFRKFKYLDALTRQYSEPLLRHYKERSQAGK